MTSKPEQIRNEKLGASLVKALEARHFEAYYCATKEEAKEKILSLIPATDVVSWGGSMTMEDLGVIEAVKKSNKVIDRDTAKTPEERVKLMHEAFFCDTYLSSTNAITQDGELLNIDGNGNRVAAMIYGPKSVVIACGMNKVCGNLEAAEDRARNVAAPINAQRFNLETPCCKTGKCADCKSTQSICNVFVRTRQSKPEGRIKVVLIGESLGF